MDGNSKRHRCIYSSRAFISESYFNLCLHELKSPYRMRYRADTNENRDQNVRSDYDSHLPEVNGRLSDFICQKDAFLSPAAKTPTIVHHACDGVQERTLAFVNELKTILLCNEKKETDRFHCNWSICYLKDGYK